MRILCGIAIVTLGISAACASRSDAPLTTSAGAQPTPAAAQAPAGKTPRDLEALMKNIGPTSQAMRMHLMANQLADAGKEAQQLAVWFGDVEQFWAQYNKADAVKWAQEARTFATSVAGAVAAGDAMKATQAANNMQGDCKQCHGTYREMDPAGGFRIKPGVLKP
jgi:cytochrome c556